MQERTERGGDTRGIFFDTKIRPIVRNPLVADAFRRVDRMYFVPPSQEFLAYTNETIPIEYGSTMSQPTLMAVMLDFLDLSGSEKVLEVGTASGYNAALLSLCAAEVHTVEYNETLATKARVKLQELGYTNVSVYTGDGAQGIPDQAPFDRIILTATAREFPQLLFEQLIDGGIIVGPVGENLNTVRLAIGKKEGNILRVQYSGKVGFILLQSSEHGGWSEEAQARRDYILEESGIPVEYPEIPDDIGAQYYQNPDNDTLIDLTGEVVDLEPKPECLEILIKHGLSPEQFMQIYRDKGMSDKKTRALLTLHPEPFETVVQMALFISTHSKGMDNLTEE